MLEIPPENTVYIAVSAIILLINAVIQIAKHNDNYLRLTRVSKINSLIDICSNEKQKEFFLSIRDQVAFKKATGAQATPEQIEVIVDLNSTGKITYKDTSKIINYLKIENNSPVIKFNIFDKSEALFSLISSIIILSMIVIFFAINAFETGKIIISLITSSLFLPFLIFISNDYRKYSRAKEIKEIFKDRNL